MGPYLRKFNPGLATFGIYLALAVFALLCTMGLL